MESEGRGGGREDGSRLRRGETRRVRAGADGRDEEPIMDGVVTLAVGDAHQLRLGKDRIVYAGMPSPDVFSIVELRWEFFYRGFAWNLFFPKEERRIRIDGVNLLVEQVTAHDITLRG